MQAEPGRDAGSCWIALESSVGRDAQNISISVANGIVTLQGAVEWPTPRDAREDRRELVRLGRRRGER